jgi:hypothetical protein
VRQCAQAFDQRRSGHEWVDCDRQLGLQAVTGARRNRLESRCAGQHRSRLLDKHAANLSQARPMPASIEAGDALYSFERGNRLTDGRLDATKLASSGGEAAGVRNGH